MHGQQNIILFKMAVLYVRLFWRTLYVIDNLCFGRYLPDVSDEPAYFSESLTDTCLLSYMALHSESQQLQSTP